MQQHIFDTKRTGLPVRRTMRGLRFDQFVTQFKESALSPTQEMRVAREEANRSLVKLRTEYRDMGPDAVHQDAAMSTLSIRFQNDELIGERILPVATVGKKSNVFFSYDERAQLAVPNTRIGPKGEVVQVTQNVNKNNSYNCEGYGVSEFVDSDELANADEPLDPLFDATMLCNEGVAFDREKRIATTCSTAANFGSNVLTIQAGEEWNSSTGGSPVKAIRKAVDSVLGGAGSSRLVGYCSANVFRVLSSHPSIRDLYKYVRDGFATQRMLADYFGLSDLLVGRAWMDDANEGQSLDLKRLWPDVFGVVRVANVPSPRSYCFGTTFRWGPPKTVQMYDPKPGRDGGYYTKVTVAEDHKIVAARAGFLITGPSNSLLDAALLA